MQVEAARASAARESAKVKERDAFISVLSLEKADLHHELKHASGKLTSLHHALQKAEQGCSLHLSPPAHADSAHSPQVYEAIQRLLHLVREAERASYSRNARHLNTTSQDVGQRSEATCWAHALYDAQGQRPLAPRLDHTHQQSPHHHLSTTPRRSLVFKPDLPSSGYESEDRRLNAEEAAWRGNVVAEAAASRIQGAVRSVSEEPGRQSLSARASLRYDPCAHVFGSCLLDHLMKHCSSLL
jgi:hypothetical protein